MAGHHDERLRRALCSLEGLSVGDAFGETFFASWQMLSRLVKNGIVTGPPYDFSEETIVCMIDRRELPSPPPWRYTDDTQMALSIVDVLRQDGEINQDHLALSFTRHYDRSRGYGAAMHSLLPRFGAGETWRRAAPGLFGGKGSYGNGAAMRVAPVGAYFADDLDAVVENARRSAEVTHAHPEAIAGAIAVAVAAAWAWRVRNSHPLPHGPEFIDLVLPPVPESEVRRGILQVRNFPDDMTVDEVVEIAGNGEDVIAQDTVPFVLWCASQHLDYFEEAMWLTVSGLGDRDTTCAMVGGIVATGTGIEGIPADWIQSREPLPDWVLRGAQK